MSKPINQVTTLPARPARPDDAHKGTFGRALIIGGSRGMSGAASLAGLGALRGGAGLVYLAIPAGIAQITAAIEPSYLTIPLSEDDHGRLNAEAQAGLSAVIPGNTAVAVGPGMGQSDDLKRLVQWLYTTVELPMVVDADGLNALAAAPDIFTQAPSPAGPRILTPHPGEFARLTGTSIATWQNDREQHAAEFASANGVVLVLKGRHTIVTDGEQLAVNTTGNSGMATGGTGDVLTGLITALLAQGMPPFEAAQLGVHLHGMAGDLAAEELSQPGMIASDLPHFLPKAWKQLDDKT